MRTWDEKLDDGRWHHIQANAFDTWIDGVKVSHHGQPCPGGDPTCPGQDGDWCHYLGPNAWPTDGIHH